MNSLFVYGSLMSTKVINTLIGRVPNELIPAVLNDYHRYKVRGEIYPAITPLRGDKVEGYVITDLSDDEIDHFDNFEGDEYNRIWVRVQETVSKEFLDCYVYVWNSDRSVLYDTWVYEKDFLPKEEKFVHNYPYFIHGMGEL